MFLESNISYDFGMLSYFSVPSHKPALSCDNISRLLNDFNHFMGYPDREIHIDMSGNNSKGFVNYWLYGTATEINWFDKCCLVG